MRKALTFLLICLLFTGCASKQGEKNGWESSRFTGETAITLSDDGVKISGKNSMNVFLTNDIVFYEDRENYESGNPYGEGEAWERHTAREADAHIVVNITAPGAYRVSGKLSAGQIRIDLGEDAYEDPNAVVELILDGAEISCTVAPAILFQNVYECDGDWDPDTAKSDVDTAKAGANLILMGENKVSGSHVAKIYKDKKGEKKLWKQDSAIYSYMSMNVFGHGSLDLTADNEGLGTELHLTIHSGDIIIRSDNDGINTNEDGVSVTTINGGNLRIIAGLGAEGDGIDSNGYLVINGGTVISSANPASDAGLDSDLGSFINGGTVVALGSAMDWAESDSGQVTMNLQFAAHQEGAIRIIGEDGTVIFEFDPGTDEILGAYSRQYQGAILSCPDFKQGDSYHVYLDDAMMGYTGTDVMMRPGGFGGGQRPDMPEGQQPPDGFGGGNPGGEMPTMPEGEMPPAPQSGMTGGNPPEPPAGETLPADRQPGGRGEIHGRPAGEINTVFYMQDKVNFFSGLTKAA